jgi:hypothetical protein
MRAAALLQRLPHPADTEPRRVRPRRQSRRKPADTARPAAKLHVAVAAPASGHADPHDSLVARVRGAGGPIDNASYTCACGFVFAASVSTTVSCPHCGAGQAW